MKRDEMYDPVGTKSMIHWVLRDVKANLFRAGMLLSVVLSVTMGCKESPDPQSTRENIESTTRPSGVVTHDRFRLRSEPNLSSSTLTLMPIDSEVIFLGEKTEDLDTISLGGIQMIEPWYQIKYLDLEGWAYGGGLAFEEPEYLDLTEIVPNIRVGPVYAAMTEDSLIAKLGPSVVKRTRLKLSDKQEVNATLLYPGSPKEMKLIWKNEDFKTLFSIEINHPNSVYHFENKIGIGTALREVQRTNQAKFSMHGFDWELSGKVISWEEGRLPASMVLFFDPTTEEYNAQLEGDIKFFSDNFRLEYAQPIVSKMKIYFPVT